MNELGRLEDLPAEYREALAQQNLVPLWPSLRAVLPPAKPRPQHPRHALGIPVAAPAADASR